MSFVQAFRTRSFEDVRRALLEHEEIALVDVREEDPHARSHPLFAANVPLSRLELDAPVRLPRQAVPIVVFDSGEGVAERAARRLGELGYTDVALLEGGLQGWREAGGELFQDVNVPSKAFGELVESVRHTPSLAAPQVQALLDHEADAVVLDARRFDEYHTMNIPGSISVPGAELVLRARQLAPNPATRIIVNCAGRTRSIIGAVADQRGCAEPGCGAAQWHHRLDAGWPGARARQFAQVRADCRRSATSGRRRFGAHGGGSREGGPHLTRRSAPLGRRSGAHRVSLRRAYAGRIRSGPRARLS
jgi:rhodanese-related sulfurtransferase